MKIPKRYQLHGQTVNVQYDSSLLAVQSARGMFHPLPNLIVLHPVDHSVGHPLASVQQTFCHEMVHSILYAMGEIGLYNKERFVDQFGHLLHQALTSMEYK